MLNLKLNLKLISTTKHVHHMHRRAPAVEIVQVTETVFVDGQGNSITSSSTQVEVTNGVPTDSSVSLVTGNAATTVANTPVTSSSSSPSSSSSSSSSSAAASSGSAASGDWVRSSYYTPGSTDNLTFLNTLGGSAGSGTWSSCFGNSLSYCAANGVDAAGSAQALNEVTVGSNVEYLIMSGSSCSGNDCGYYREGIPAYHGFGGSQKIFVFEFQMPSDSGSSALNGDMPAIWMLNAKIPRTLQYGDSSCSCWSTGCGELDLFEVLSSGEGADKLISHIHSGQGSNGSSQGGGGSQYYFDRPYTGTMKAAIIFDNGNISIVKLDDSTSFDSSISSSVVSSWENTSGAQYAQLL
ncbi:unnamed protein product [[Candida] boidinii]|nr:unnamed protein product [[Candida] boidinii]